MNFYAASGMPVYRVERESRPKSSKVASKTSRLLGLHSPHKDTAPPPVRPVTSSDVVPHDANSIDRLLDPAVDGPPSPECLRELSQQMRQGSFRDKHLSNQTSSSGSSSLRSLTSADRPSWEHPLDSRTLSRKSSGRSTSSSMPSRERPESVQIFGKKLFARRGKGRRESSAQSSSSSMYSTDAVDPALPAAQTSAPSRDSTIPALFSGIRRSKQDAASDAQRKLNISMPYNFQHVAHTQKDQVPESHIVSRENGTVSADPGADDMHFADFSTDSLPLDEEDAEAAATVELRKTTSLTRTSSVVRKTSTSRRILSRSQSQDQLSMNIPPPRPPRSPVERSAPGGSARGLSRILNRHERFDSVDRPVTSACFRSQPSYADAGSPPATSYGFMSDMDVIHEHGHSTSIGSQDDANWPLPCPSSTASEFTLPNVPEEDESTPAVKKSRASVASNSSLRGSQSVPMLRALASLQNGDSARRPSDASDTVARFDMFAAQRALRESLDENGDLLPRADWEDDIDYCYDHEAEADCDYEWSRPSLETCRDGETATPVDHQGRGADSCSASPAMLTPAQFDVPALSPASQLSLATGQEAITPTVVTNPKASNFSLPRLDSKNLLHIRKSSDASSFKESHGFTLSPSLLIPPDFQQQMLACEAERQEASEFAFRPSDEPELNMDPSALVLQYRTSASTTGTAESSTSAFDKHNSTASSSTDYTRMTASVSSLEMETCPPAPEPLQRFPSLEMPSKVEAQSALATLPEVVAPSRPFARRPRFKTRGSESNLLMMGVDEPHPAKARPSILTRRGRARTTSLSTPPPSNQYALFPQVQLSGNRI
ncbi:uncharacterized protein C8A04DRAFT_34572 [Dichotomopilus funicola]|uniref:CRIB domain-containing protein n=1 Tax=Dichotomopilus funicola TaxID=1934379 RepID=A0AAN6V9T4_9PEZI|nr:hypothetical protein C8A04DRAFT_34572 [Dichotomopilus funicola]